MNTTISDIMEKKSLSLLPHTPTNHDVAHHMVMTSLWRGMCKGLLAVGFSPYLLIY